MHLSILTRKNKQPPLLMMLLLKILRLMLITTLKMLTLNTTQVFISKLADHPCVTWPQPSQSTTLVLTWPAQVSSLSLTGVTLRLTDSSILVTPPQTTTLLVRYLFIFITLLVSFRSRAAHLCLTGVVHQFGLLTIFSKTYSKILLGINLLTLNVSMMLSNKWLLRRMWQKPSSLFLSVLDVRKLFKLKEF